jgi:glycosyltransferase involved in cell wall biosynthesis
MSLRHCSVPLSLRCLSAARRVSRVHVQIAACIPVLRLLRRSAKILFYCHFPDLLLVQRGSWLKRLYRMPFDALEQSTTALADNIVVNSAFTRGVFERTFTWISRWMKIAPGVLHPCVDVGADTDFPDTPTSPRVVFLSINRFERKKAIHLALEALACLRGLVTPGEFRDVELVVAGGYDPRVLENVEYYDELVALAEVRPAWWCCGSSALLSTPL